MRTVLTTYDPIELNFAQTLLKEAEIETIVLDGSVNRYAIAMCPAHQLMVLADEDVEKAMTILRDGMKDAPIES